MKAVREVERKYYKWVDWVQPILTANKITVNEGDIVCTSSNVNNAELSNHTYQALDGIKSGSLSAGNGWVSGDATTGWWQVKFPYKLKITKLIRYNNFLKNADYTQCTGQFFTDSSKTVAMGSSFTSANNSNWASNTITFAPIITDTIYFAKTGGKAWSGIGELDITAQRVKEVDSSDYDYYIDIPTYKLPKINDIYYAIK